MTITDMELENTATIDGNTASVMEAAVEKKHVAKVRKTKEKKTTIAAAPKKTKKTVLSHPTYEEMIKDAIVTLKERTGSCQYAIQKFIEEKRKELPPTFRNLLLHHLRRLVASGKLVKVKASFKLPKTAATSVPTKKKSATAVVTKPKVKVTAAKKVTVKAKVVPRATAAPKRKDVAATAKATKKVKEVKERNTTIAAAQKKKKTVSSHPTYEEMIKDAVVTLKERTGSSQHAIQKFIEEKHKELPPTFKKLLLHNLKRFVASGKLVKVKASFKLPSASAAKSSSPKAAATSVPTKKKSRVQELPEKVLEEQAIDDEFIIDSSELLLDPTFDQVQKCRPSQWQTVIDDLMDEQFPGGFLMCKAHRE